MRLRPLTLSNYQTKREKLDCASSTDEVHDDRDDGEDQKQVDEPAGDMKQSEATEPEDDENDCEDKEHGTFFLGFVVRVLHLAESKNTFNSDSRPHYLQAMRAAKCPLRCMSIHIP